MVEYIFYGRICIWRKIYSKLYCTNKKYCGGIYRKKKKTLNTCCNATQFFLIVHEAFSFYRVPIDNYFINNRHKISIPPRLYRSLQRALYILKIWYKISTFQTFRHVLYFPFKISLNRINSVRFFQIARNPPKPVKCLSGSN